MNNLFNNTKVELDYILQDKNIRKKFSKEDILFLWWCHQKKYNFDYTKYNRFAFIGEERILEIINLMKKV